MEKVSKQIEANNALIANFKQMASFADTKSDRELMNKSITDIENINKDLKKQLKELEKKKTPENVVVRKTPVIKNAPAPKKEEPKKEEKPKQPEKKKVGRPKKFDITKFSGEELLKAQEEEERKRDAREAEIIERRRVAYEKRLEKLKQQRAEKNATRGRPKIEKAPKPKKEKPEKPTTELKPKEIRKLFLIYRNRVFKYGRDDLFAGGERERLMLINIIEKNSNLTRDELLKTYKDLQKKVTDIPKFLIWLDSMIFAIYIRSNELGERIRIAESGRGVRNDDDKDPRPEYLSFIKDDYEKNSVEYWTVFNYYRLKTGNWSKSMKMM
jgi:hypothetical protein